MDKKTLAFINMILLLIIIGTSIRFLADGYYLWGAAGLLVAVLRFPSAWRHFFFGVDEEQDEEQEVKE